MPKYRALTMEELASLEDEFVKFLVLNGIDSEEWIKLKDENPDKAQGVCEAFSDVVYQRVLQRCRYVEYHAPHRLISIYCDDDKMHLVGVEAPLDSDLDFTDPDQFEKFKTQPPEGLKKISSTKTYDGDRELEIWNHLQRGFFIADSKLYVALFDA